MVIGFPKSTFVSREFFYFQILEGGHSLSGTVLGARLSGGAERANKQFSVIARESLSSVNKVFSGTPLPDR